MSAPEAGGVAQEAAPVPAVVHGVRAEDGAMLVATYAAGLDHALVDASNMVEWGLLSEASVSEEDDR